MLGNIKCDWLIIKQLYEICWKMVLNLNFRWISEFDLRVSSSGKCKFIDISSWVRFRFSGYYMCWYL